MPFFYDSLDSVRLTRLGSLSVINLTVKIPSKKEDSSHKFKFDHFLANEEISIAGNENVPYTNYDLLYQTNS